MVWPVCQDYDESCHVQSDIFVHGSFLLYKGDKKSRSFPSPFGFYVSALR